MIAPQDAPFAAAPYSPWPPEPLLFPGPYIGVTWRRVLAYFIDLWIIGLIVLLIYFVWLTLTVITLGLFGLLFVLVGLIPVGLFYHVLQLAGPGATLGMRLFGLRAWRMDGGKPTLAQAIIHTIGLYLTLGFSGGILMLAALFNARRRTIHDFVSDIAILRER